ncbi:MAG: hypothetical protein U0M21_00620 [Emergencia sp.]|nr:hypothetical protein [Emergencia sp.]
MSLKEEFLNIKNYKEFDKRRDEFRTLKVDEEVREHLGVIFNKVYFAPKDFHVDVFRKTPDSKEPK